MDLAPHGQNGVDAYGNIYVQGYGGVICCYNTANGNLLWQFGNGGAGNSTNDGLNSPWGLLPTIIYAIADGKVYVYTNSMETALNHHTTKAK